MCAKRIKEHHRVSQFRRILLTVRFCCYFHLAMRLSARTRAHVLNCLLLRVFHRLPPLISFSVFIHAVFLSLTYSSSFYPLVPSLLAIARAPQLLVRSLCRVCSLVFLSMNERHKYLAEVCMAQSALPNNRIPRFSNSLAISYSFALRQNQYRNFTTLIC